MYDFLHEFERRMKKIAPHVKLASNIMNKSFFRNYGFLTIDESYNLVISVMLFILDMSLKDRNCTMNDIADYIGEIDSNYFRKGLTNEDCKILAFKIIIEVLCNGGEEMVFDAYNFDKEEVQSLEVLFLDSKVIYQEDNKRLTSYFLTSQGYEFILSTLEIEENMRMPVESFIFKKHFESMDYDKASQDVQRIFTIYKQRIATLTAAMKRVKENILYFMPDEYSHIIDENFSTLREQKLVTKKMI